MKNIIAWIATLLCLLGTASPNALAADAQGFVGTTILIIRHAEKPANKADGPGLTPAGESRARAYADYFRHFNVDGVPVQIDTLIATADTRNSDRPRLTVEPFSKASRLPIQQPFDDDNVKGLADWLASGPPNRKILIAWHHERIPKLLAALGADPNSLIPGGAWPAQTYDWVIVLHYDGNGRLATSKRIVEPEFR